MKRTRTFILVGVIVATLFAAVLPSLAVVVDPSTALNWSFEGDKNNDNIPDKWNVKGDVFRTCDHPYYPGDTLTPCAMVFPPSSKSAALYQDVNGEFSVEVLTEEGETVVLALALAGGKKLDWYRAYYGIRFDLPDGTTITLYDDVSGGNFPFSKHFFLDTAGSWAKNGFSTDSFRHGILVLPGDGYLGVDEVSIDL